MRERLRKIYYCDYCKKKGMKKNLMKKHEEHCTLNPDRSCRMCEINGWPTSKPSELAALFVEPDRKSDFWAENYIDMSKAKVICDGCPACLLAAIRYYSKTNKDSYAGFDFNFKEAAASFFKQYNDENPRYESY